MYRTMIGDAEVGDDESGENSLTLSVGKPGTTLPSGEPWNMIQHDSGGTAPACKYQYWNQDQWQTK